MQDLRIALVQSRLHWEDIGANLARFTEWLSTITEPVDLVVLPEMFSTGFTMNAAAIAEKMNGKAVNWMREQSAAINAVISGSVVIEEDGNYYNRMIWMQPDGNYHSYDKRHLFSMAGEEKVYTSGTKKLIVELKEWKICPMVCYDLRFPVWIRNVEKYDVLLFCANWPERRVQHWRKLLLARAIENQCFVAGVNVVGTDGNDFVYTGHSMAVDTMGEIMTEVVDEEKIEIVTLNYDSLKLTRRYMQFLDDRDEFKIVRREKGEVRREK